MMGVKKNAAVLDRLEQPDGAHHTKVLGSIDYERKDRESHELHNSFHGAIEQKKAGVAQAEQDRINDGLERNMMEMYAFFVCVCLFLLCDHTCVHAAVLFLSSVSTCLSLPTCLSACLHVCLFQSCVADGPFRTLPARMARVQPHICACFA